MAAFKQHITFSSLLGIGYAASLGSLGVEWVHSTLAGGLCGFAGMLPDLDSASGRPIKEVFGIAAIAVPLLLARRLLHTGMQAEEVVLVGAGLYLLIRFGVSWVFKHLTVHRGMFHSIPAALIAGEIVFLAHDCPTQMGRLTLAGGVILGFLSHLILDEIWSVDMNGLAIRLNKAAGSAMKFFSKSALATLTTWLMLTGLSYLVGVDIGYFRPLQIDWQHLKIAGQTRPGALPAAARPTDSSRRTQGPIPNSMPGLPTAKPAPGQH
jgi:hypothetical protein